MKKNKATNEQPLSKIGSSSQDRAQACFHRGTNARAYEYFGAHPTENGFVFRLWAPHAERVSLCGNFNNWDPDTYPMTKIAESGIWELCLSKDQIAEGAQYKYVLRNREKTLFKADPFAFFAEKAPGTASVLYDLEGHAWRDEGWMHYRKGKFSREAAPLQPINIYELHAGSWKQHGDGRPYSYTELARELVCYVKQMGYTHIELMPIAEHPFDGSWGYQVCGYYAPTSRYGTPKDLMELVNIMHEAGIGVILDWVPAHFPKDGHGLFELDGEPLYEYEDPARREIASWGTRFFDVGRPEVQSFLISNAIFWAEKYHIDGLRTDAVAAMLYLDYDKQEGEWKPNMYGDNRNLEAISFFQKLNSRMSAEFPDVMMIAEESSEWGNLTGFDRGGLGFTFKWNMGWMNDSLAYLREDPLYRRYHHNKLTFPLTYAFGEHYILPISHDEVVHGKKSLLDRSHGNYEQKFASTRAYLTYMITHPGKKLLFMGSEYGQFCEWDHTKSLEWFLLDYDMHAKLQLFTSELNHFYLANPPLWEQDDGWEGFEWIDADNAEKSIYSYRRKDKKGRELIILLNFLPQKQENFLLAVPESGVYEEIFNTDATRFGGKGMLNPGKHKTESCLLRGYQNAIRINIPPMSGLIFRCARRTARKKQQTNKII